MKCNTLLCVVFVIIALGEEATSQDNLKTIGPEAFSVLKTMHGYDKELPLDTIVDVSNKNWPEGDGTLERILFKTFDSTMVPFTLLYPNNLKKPVPCVLLLHGLGQNQDQWFSTENQRYLAFSKRLLNSGMAVAAMDARNHGRRNHQFDYKWPVRIATKNLVFTYQEMAVSTVIDYRRLLDYLETREEIDQNRFGALGVSMGGMFTFELAGVDERIKATVACIPPITNWDWAVEAPFFAPHIKNCAVRMLVGRADPFITVNQARDLHRMLATKKKDLIFFEGGHEVPPRATEDALNWLTAHLKTHVDE